MKPVDQTRCNCGDSLTEAPGNCWAACIASILEFPLSDVPDEAEFWKPGMTARESWVPYEKRMHEFLFQHGLILFEVQKKNSFYGGPIEILDQAFFITSGPSPRNPKVNHAIITRAGEVAHDPHPSRMGLVGEPAEWWNELLVKAR